MKEGSAFAPAEVVRWLYPNDWERILWKRRWKACELVISNREFLEIRQGGDNPGGPKLFDRRACYAQYKINTYSTHAGFTENSPSQVPNNKAVANIWNRLVSGVQRLFFKS